jgi:hypothetical protein
MKLEQLTQGMAATLASLFLILTLCAFRMARPHAIGEQVYPTYAFQLASGFNDCMDDHQLVYWLHLNQSLSINDDIVPIRNLPAITHQILKLRTNPEVWLRVDPQVAVGEAVNVLNMLHANSPSANVFLITEHEMDEYFNPRNGFEYIGPAHPERFPHSPSVCTFLK